LIVIDTSYVGFTDLCGLAAAQELSTEQLLQPLKVVVRHCDMCTQRLCSLPAAQQLSNEAVTQLLLAAVAARTPWPRVDCIMQWLLALPAAKAIVGEVEVQLLQAAYSAACSKLPGPWVCMEKLVTLPAAEQLEGATVGLLLQAAVDAACMQGTLHTLSSPAAAQLSRDQVHQALIAAIEFHGHSCSAGCLAKLCQLPAAAQLGSQQVASALLCRAALELTSSSRNASCQQQHSSAASS
jgi:hypothetical protein